MTMTARLRDDPLAVTLQAGCAGLAALVAPAALAHHVAGFARPTTLGTGLLSGLGHPVIGLGSLAFLLAIGIWCARAAPLERSMAGVPPRLLTLLTLLAGTVAGGTLDAAGLVLPADDLLVAISVIAAGVLLSANRRAVSPSSIPAITAAIGIAAVVHGMVAAEGSAGAAGGPLLAYWAGILLMQAVLWFAAYRGAAAVMAARPAAAERARTAAAGVVLLAGAALAAYPGISLIT